MKKHISLILLTILMFTASAFPASADDRPTITWMLSNDNAVNSTNDVLEALEAKLGCNIEVICTTNEDYNSKLNTLIASGNIPDIYKVTDSGILTQLKDGDALLNMEDLIDANAPDMKAYYGDRLYLSPYNKDGIYVINSEAGMYMKNLAIRKDWLANVGLEVPTTTDELFEVMKAFTFNDPDGNGKNDTYGYAPWMTYTDPWQNILGAFGIPATNWTGLCLLEDGTVTTFLKHPNFKTAMQFLRRLYAEGIMNPDFVTITQMQGFEQLWNGKVGILGFQSIGTSQNWYPSRYTWNVPKDPADQFAFAIINGHGSTIIYPTYTKADAVINSKTKYPELCLQLINYVYFTPEGQELTYMGIEGKHFNWIDKETGSYEMIGEYTDQLKHRAAGATVYNASGGFTAENAETRLFNELTREAQENERAVGTDHPCITSVLDSVNEYNSTLLEIVKEAFASLIVSKGDWEAEYEDFLKRWNEEGGFELEVEATAAYKKQLEQQSQQQP